MTDKITIELTERQARTLSNACEMVTRLYMGQMDVLQNISAVNWNECQEIKKICFPNLSGNEYYRASSDLLPDESRQLYDIHQVMRHWLAWKNQDNTPETRDFGTQFGVNFDEPMRMSKECELPVVRQVVENKND